MIEENIQSEIYYFDEKTCEKKKIKKAILSATFLFSKIDFYVFDVGKYYSICISNDGSMFSLWRFYKNGLDDKHGEAISEFRKLFIKEKIKIEDIELFVTNPSKYKEKKNRAK